MKKILTKIKRWYQGYVDFQNHINNPNHPRIIITAYPPSSLSYFFLFAHKFWIKNWQWLITTTITTIVAIIGLYIAWLTLITPK